MVQEKYPEGHFIGKSMGIGTAIGAGLGFPFGLIIGNPAFFGIGLPIGLAIGAAVGTNLEKKAKEEGRIRPLTKEEAKRKKIGIYAGLGLGVLLFIVVLALYLLS